MPPSRTTDKPSDSSTAPSSTSSTQRRSAPYDRVRKLRGELKDKDTATGCDPLSGQCVYCGEECRRAIRRQQEDDEIQSEFEEALRDDGEGSGKENSAGSNSESKTDAPYSVDTACSDSR